MSAGHTPGPWLAHPFRYGDNDPRWRIIQRGQAGGAAGLAVVHPRCNAKSPEVVAANARLIAAAPDLLEALREIVGQHGQWNNGMWAANIASAAIAKATGATP